MLAELPPEYAADGLTTPQATWLWRTLRAAEVAGLDAAEVVRQAVAARSLSGARDVASVIDSRLRKLVDPLVPHSPAAVVRASAAGQQPRTTANT